MPASIPQKTLGKNGPSVGIIGFGCMLMSWAISADQLKPDEELFPAIKAAIDNGANFLNSGVFYNIPGRPYDNLRLLSRFFDKHPGYADKVVVSVKGGVVEANVQKGLDSSYDNLKTELEAIRKNLGPKKQLDMFEPCRVDPKFTIEEIMQTLIKLRDEGYFKYISLSEIHPEALKRAVAVGPVNAVEIEFSLFSMEPEAKDIIKLAEQEDIAVIAYSPLGRGMLTGRFKTVDDLPEGDMRRHQPRYQGDNFKVNLEIVDKLNEIAQKKGVTPGQLALGYIIQYSDKVIPIPGSGNAERAIENIGAAKVSLTKEEIASIDDVLSKFKVSGGRYPEHVAALSWGKGKQ